MNHRLLVIALVALVGLACGARRGGGGDTDAGNTDAGVSDAGAGDGGLNDAGQQDGDAGVDGGVVGDAGFDGGFDAGTVTVRFVDPTAPSAGDGRSWATAFNTVQAAVDSAATSGGGEVWVASGTHTNGGGQGSVLTLRSGVSVYGGFDGYKSGTGAREATLAARNFVANVTVLDGATTALHVVIGANNARLDGFTITRGNASGTGAAGNGGGMYNADVSPTVDNCLFTANNAAVQGGGMHNSSTSGTRTTPVVTRTVFSSNTSGDYGGALYNTQSNGRFESCTFSSNTSANYGGAIANNQADIVLKDSTLDANRADYGGGMNNTFSSTTVSNTTFSNNVADDGGSFGSAGGLYDNFSNSKISGSTFVGNRARGSGGGIHIRDSGTKVTTSTFRMNTADSGAGIYVWNTLGGGTPTFMRVLISGNRAINNGGGAVNDEAASVYVSCVIEGNSAGSSGGGMYNMRQASPRVVNSTFLSNFAGTGAELYSTAFSTTAPTTVTVQNSILWNNTPATSLVHDVTGMATTTITYSDVEGGAVGAGNINASPGFNNVPTHTNRIGIGATTTTVSVTNASTLFSVGDIIEIGDNGTARTVTAVSGNTITFDPALAAAPVFYTRIDRWASAANLTVDVTLAAASACIDAANNTLVPADSLDLDADGNITEPVPQDFSGLSRFVDKPETDTGLGPAPIADIGGHERQ